VEIEQLWLPRLARLLPLEIPVPIAKGEPGQGYPWHWSVYRWLDGQRATIEELENPQESAVDLAKFIASLQQISVTGWPQPPPVSARAERLSMRDTAVREAMASLQGVVDTKRATKAWEVALAAPGWAGTHVWVHADLHSANLLSKRGRISAVLDFGCLGLGDPACDVMAAWTFLSSSTRDAFRATLQVDDASWARARGWALSVGLIALPYYRTTNPAFAAIARRAIDEAASDLCA
jgi:aminoglycoside phosphotransferase (APT) family kinase protein